MLMFFLASYNIFLTILIFLNNNLLDPLPASTESSQGMPSFQKQSPKIFSACIYQPRFRREKIGLPCGKRSIREPVAIFILSCMSTDTNTRRKALIEHILSWSYSNTFANIPLVKSKVKGQENALFYQWEEL